MIIVPPMVIYKIIINVLCSILFDNIFQGQHIW